MLFELGAYRLLGNDPERTWRFTRAWIPPILDRLAENVSYGMARIPAEGGVVVAANHLSAIDPAALGIHSLRTIRYMTKVELLQMPISVGSSPLKWFAATTAPPVAGSRPTP